MTNQHPIVPPPELVQQWFDAWSEDDFDEESFADYVAVRAAQWGADQELEACCEWLASLPNNWTSTALKRVSDLRAARRPKPPSLKEQAYAALDAYIYGNPDHGDKQNTYNIIRRALEALPE